MILSEKADVMMTHYVVSCDFEVRGPTFLSFSCIFGDIKAIYGDL